MAMTAEGSMQEPVEETESDVTMTPDGPVDEEESGGVEHPLEDGYDEKDDENLKDDDELGDPDEEKSGGAWVRPEDDRPEKDDNDNDDEEERERLVDSVPTVQNPPNWGHFTDEECGQVIEAIQYIAEELDIDAECRKAFPLLYRE